VAAFHSLNSYVRHRTVDLSVADYYCEMLSDFLTSNHDELITRCKDKAARRLEPAGVPARIGHGVPVFLQQLGYVLREEAAARFSDSADGPGIPSNSGMGPTAESRGAELLSHGYTIDQVVHEYGDVCQAVTELAVEKEESISTDDFRILNRCLDNAIAGAVTSYGAAIQSARNWHATELKGRMGSFAAEARRLIDVATKAFAAIQMGNVGTNGATGSLLGHTLAELGFLVDHGIPEIPSQSSARISTDGKSTS
jgi:hypothetical protein